MTGGLGRDFSQPIFRDEINKKLSHLEPEQTDKFWRLYSAGQNRQTAAVASQRKLLLDLFHQSSDDIVDGLNQVFDQHGADTWDLRTMRRMGQDERLFKAINDRIRALGGRVDATVEQGMLDSFKRAYAESGYRTDMMTPGSVDINFGMMPDRDILALLQNPDFGSDFSDRIGLITSEMTDNIKRELLRSMINQESWQQAARRIRDEMGTRGTASVWRAEMIARTELARAASMGSAQFNSENADVIEDVVWMAHAGACEICLDLNGTILKDVEDYPPELSHPNACFAGASFVPYGELKQMIKASYRGPAMLLSISVDGGTPQFKDIAIGPNHPILTRRGFVVARDIQEGDQLIYDAMANDAGADVGKLDLKKVPLIENVFQSLVSIFGYAGIASAASYFHGDETFIYGEVEVVRPTGQLLPILDPGTIEHICKCDLVGAYTEASHVASCGSCQSRFDRIFSSPTSDPALKVGKSSPFKFGKITAVHSGSFIGDAFDASTSSELYNYGGIVVKNCTCTATAVPKAWSDIVGDPDTAVPPPRVSFADWIDKRGVAIA